MWDIKIQLFYLMELKTFFISDVYNWSVSEAILVSKAKTHTSSLTKMHHNIWTIYCQPSEDCSSIIPVVLNGFPFFPLNAKCTCTKTRFTQRNVMRSLFYFFSYFWEDGGEANRKKRKPQQSVKMWPKKDMCDNPHRAFQELMLGVTAWSDQLWKGQRDRLDYLSHYIHPKEANVWLWKNTSTVKCTDQSLNILIYKLYCTENKRKCI